MVYWICFAFFTCFELISDALMSWFPFYYEIKVIFFIWLLGPSSRGAMKLYKSVIHPTLVAKEQVTENNKFKFISFSNALIFTGNR